MRISELLHETSLNEVTRPPIEQAQDILSKAGYEMIGSGFESLVFKRPGDSYVLKLIDAYATAYFDFIKLAQSSANLHFPRFKGKITNVLPGYYQAIRMEPLTPLTVNGKRVAKIIDNYTKALQDSNGKSIDFPGIDELEKDQPGIKEACHLLVTNIFNKKHYYNDMHIDNFMMRGNTVVITDPVIFDDAEY